MNSFAEIVDEFFRIYIQKNGAEAPKTVAAQADFFGISAAQMSRLKAGKSGLTDHVLEKVLNKFKKHNLGDKKKFEAELKLVQASFVPEPIAKESLESRYSLSEGLENLFSKVASKNALLLVDYRDLPQVYPQGTHSDLVEPVINAVKEGLNIALFNPFGSPKSLLEINAYLNKAFVDETGGASFMEDPNRVKHVNDFFQSYGYLLSLTARIYSFYKAICEQLTLEERKQVVLYDAGYWSDRTKNFTAIPTLTASGMQSRLFYAEYLESGSRQTKVFEWIVAAGRSGDEHLFVERSNRSLSFNAVRMQFNPIPSYFSESGSLPDECTIGAAYDKFGLKLFGATEQIRWIPRALPE
jgi:hypothetical protein